MAPQRQKRIKRKLPSRNIVDADFVSSSASARIMDDLLLPSHNDRAILSSLWNNQETTRSELPHVVIASTTRRRLVQPSTNTVEKTYLQRLQEQRKDTTDLSAQSIIPIALVNNMNAKATTEANNATTDSDSETETYTTLSPINQQVGTGTEHTFSYGVSHDQSTHDDKTGLCPVETDKFQLSLNVLQVTGIDCLHTQEHEPDHSNEPMVATDESIVNDQAPVSICQAVMMKGEDKMMECEDSMETETVNENYMMEEAEHVNEKEAQDVNEDVNDNYMMEEAEYVNDQEMMDGAEDVNELHHSVDNLNEEEDNDVDTVAKRGYDEGTVESDQESSREDSEESAREDGVMDIVVKRECEEEIVESEEESAREPDKESSRDDDEESAREDEEGTVEADEANEEKAVEDHAVENEEDPVDSSPKSSQPSFDPEEEITLCMRSVEPVSCLFATVIRKNDLVPIKYEPIDESEYASSTEEPTNNTLSCSSEEPTHNDPSCSSDGFMNNVVSPHSDEAMNSATSVHSDQTTSNAVSDRSDDIISSFVSDYSEESTNNVLPVYSQRLIHTVVPYQDTSNAMYNHSDEEAAHATVSGRCYAMNGNAAASAHSSQTTASNATHPSDEASHNSVSDRCYAIASDVVSDNFNESMNNTAPCYSDVCVSEEEETLSLQVLSEEPSSCLYRMPASLEREGGLVAIKQEPIDEVAADTETLANLINPYRYDMADTKVKQEPLEGESCTAKECGLMETEHQSSDLRGHNPEISDMQDIECCSEGKDADSNTVCGMVTDALSVQQVVYSPSVAGSSSIGDDDDWMVLEDLEEDVEEEQDDIYKKIFDVMIESKPIMIKPGQNKGHKRFRLDAWIEDNKSPIVLTNEEKERACKRRKIMKAKLHKPFIIKKKINCVWLVEADTA